MHDFEWSNISRKSKSYYIFNNPPSTSKLPDPASFFASSYCTAQTVTGQSGWFAVAESLSTGGSNATSFPGTRHRTVQELWTWNGTGGGRGSRWGNLESVAIPMGETCFFCCLETKVWVSACTANFLATHGATAATCTSAKYSPFHTNNSRIASTACRTRALPRSQCLHHSTGG